MVRSVVFAALLSSACRFDADYGGTSYRCEDPPICPAGFTCIDGLCRTQPLDAGSDPADAAPPPPTLGDILTYTFDDYPVTDVAHDRSGHRHDATDRSLTLVAGRYRQGLSLTGSPLDIPDADDLFSPGRLTIEMWLFRDGGGVRQALFSDYSGAGSGPDATELSLEIDEEDRLVLLVAPGCSGGGPPVAATSDGTVPVTTWTHVAAVWDGGEVRFYLDGVEVGVAPIGDGCQRESPFVIGERKDGTAELRGAVDEVKLSSAAKSQEMIAASMSYDTQAAPAICGDLLIEEETCDGPGLCCASCRHRDDATSCNGDLGACTSGVCLPAGDPPRVQQGIVALYRFDDASGATIADSSPNDLDLTIGNPAGVTWGAGQLTVIGPAAIASAQTMAFAACTDRSELTIEAWVAAASTTRQARVVGLVAPEAITASMSQANRAWTSGVSSSRALDNGHPVVDTLPDDVTTELTHLAMSRSADGWRRLYVDGALRGTNRVEGALAWSPTETIVLASDLDGSDDWRGTFHLVALYCRALDELEVAQNFAAGAD